LETLNLFETNVTPSYMSKSVFIAAIFTRCEPFITCSVLSGAHVRWVDSQSRNTGFQHGLL